MPRVAQAARLIPGWETSLGDYVTALAWTPRGARLLAASADGGISVLEPEQGQVSTIGEHPRGALCVSVRADGEMYASGGQDGKLALWDAAALREVARLPGDAAWVEHVAFQPRGTLIAAAAGKHLKLWSPDGALVRTLSDHASTIAAIGWDSNGRQLAAAAYGGLWIHGVAGTPSASNVTVATHTLTWQGSALSVAWHPDNKIIASGMQDGTVHFWRSGARESAQMSGYPTKVRQTSWSASGRFLATGGGEQITVWDFRGKGPEGTRPLELNWHVDLVAALAFHPQSHYLASGGRDGRLALWHPGETLASLDAHQLPAIAAVLAWSADGKRLAVGCESGLVRLYDLA